MRKRYLFNTTLILFYLFSSFYGVTAKCIKDIVAAGISFDSVKYDAEKDDGSNLSLVTSSALGLKASWIIYCPKKKMEFRPFLRIRSYSFNDVQAQTSLGGVEEKKNFLSFGLEARKFKKIWGKPFEIPLILELRQEMGFGINYNSQSIYSEDYINIKAMGGLRYFAWRESRHDITVVGKLGLLAGVTGESSVGVIYGISSEYYYKIGKAISFELNMYLDQYSQGYDEITMKRTEFGLRSNMVFRF